jgi:twitching motility protein PilT
MGRAGESPRAGRRLGTEDRHRLQAPHMSSVDHGQEPSLVKRQELEIEQLFRVVVKLNGSHLHLKSGRPPFVRVQGVLRSLDREPVDDEEMARLIFPMLELQERRKRIFDEDGGVDFAHIIDYESQPWRFRVNVLQQMGHVGMVAMRGNTVIPNFESLHLPASLSELCKYSQGMILLAGITSSGKSTTIASMLDWINHHYRKHILTLEDPIEFTFVNDLCVINQREIGTDVKDFSIGMKHGVREDPDVMVVGEMRDRETFETAIHAAETGHLVFGTIHASTAPSTVGRILDLFPREMHPALRSAMVFNIKAIIVQKLLPSIMPGAARVPACEIMYFSPTVRKLLLAEQDNKLGDAIRIGKDEGMQDFTMALSDLVHRGMVDRAAAFEVAPNVEALKMALKGFIAKESGML